MIRAQGRQRAARRRKVAGLALALVFLAGSLAISAHGAFTVHRLCPEHGEWIESGGAHASAAGARAGVSQARVAPDSAAAAQSHEHCALLGVARERAMVAIDGAQLACDPPADRAGWVSPASPLPDGAPLGSPGARGPPAQA
jgi:hypothetical protein